ncbi:amidohydrolase, partial [Mycobacterium sp. ITM-2017-0098]
VMGRRGVDRELATAEDLAMMRKLAAEAVQAGALGFASSRLTLPKTSGGQPIPSYEAEYAEIEAIARGIDDAGGGLLQFVPDLMAG